MYCAVNCAVLTVVNNHCLYCGGCVELQLNTRNPLRLRQAFNIQLTAVGGITAVCRVYRLYCLLAAVSTVCTVVFPTIAVFLVCACALATAAGTTAGRLYCAGPVTHTHRTHDRMCASNRKLDSLGYY